MKTMFIVAFAAALAGGSVAASAQDTTSVRVNVSDLDLQSSAGQHTAAQRVATATRIACGSESSGKSLAENARISACRDAATKSAMQRFEAPQIASN